MTDLTDYELKILRHLNGEAVPDLAWGAAMSVAIEYLRGDGYVTGYTNVVLTDKGRAAATDPLPDHRRLRI